MLISSRYSKRIRYFACLTTFCLPTKFVFFFAFGFIYNCKCCTGDTTIPFSNNSIWNSLIRSKRFIRNFNFFTNLIPFTNNPTEWSINYRRFVIATVIQNPHLHITPRSPDDYVFPGRTIGSPLCLFYDYNRDLIAFCRRYNNISICCIKIKSTWWIGTRIRCTFNSCWWHTKRCHWINVCERTRI